MGFTTSLCDQNHRSDEYLLSLTGVIYLWVGGKSIKFQSGSGQGGQKCHYDIKHILPDTLKSRTWPVAAIIAAPLHNSLTGEYKLDIALIE